MRTFLRLLAVFSAVAFVLVTIAVVFFHPIGTRAMGAEMYQAALAQERIYAKVPVLVGDTVRFALEEKARQDRSEARETSAEQKAFEALVRQIEPRDWTTLLGGVVPPELLQKEVERGLDEADRFLHGEGDARAGRISLVEVKRRLLGAEAVEAYAAMLSSKPECSAEQFDQSMGLPIACRPSADKMAVALENFSRLAHMAAEQVPDEIDLLENLRKLDGPEGFTSALTEVRTSIWWVETLARWSPALPVALAILIALFAVRSGRDLLFWWGVPCLVAGGIAAIIAGGGVSFGIGMMSGIATSDLPADVPVALVEAILGVSTALMRAVMLPALWSSLAIGVGGLVALIIAMATRPKTVAAPPPVPA